MASKRTVIDVLLPVLIFPSLSALAINTIFGHMIKSGLADSLNAQCPKTVSSLDAYPYRLQYTGLNALDQQLCVLVAFFHIAMQPVTSPFLSYFLGTAGSLSAITAVESFRRTRHFSIGYPLIFGLLCQTASLGATMPLFWLLFILTGAAKLHARPRTDHTLVTHGHAEAILFGIAVGSVIPTVCMFLLEDPHVTAIWQAFPVWVAIAQLAHISFRPSSRYPESGYITVQALFIFLFIVSSSTHLAAVWPKINDHEALKSLLLPSVSILDPAADINLKALDFLKWDAAFGFASSIIATFWFAANTKQLVALLAWHLVAVPVFGPGAAVAGALTWRESVLNG